ncbi:MAG TPA: 50S ribosomal protein L35 [Candidatus Paceibacterota bacterium]
MKTNKSFTKRLRVTKNGKIIARKPGLNHFNAKKSRQNELNKKRTQEINFSKKVVQRFLPNN